MGERMTGADAAWLHMDRPTNRMIVNLVLSFEQQPDWEAVREAVQERLVAHYSRLRQRVAEPAVALPPMSVPEWVDDPHFRLEDHVHRTTLPAPGDAGELHAYIEAHIGDPMDPIRPLWQLHLIDNYRGASALLLRAHHALGDGTALMHAVLALSDPDDRQSQGSAALTAPPSDAAGGPSGYRIILASVSDGLTSFSQAVLGVPAHREAFGARVRSLAKLASARQDRPTVLRAKLGISKSVTWCDPVPLVTVKAAAQSAGATVNDVLLGVIAAGLGRYLREHGSDVAEIGAMLPVNLRALDEPMPRRWGNKFGLGYPMLPVAPMSRGDRLTTIHQAMRQIKQTKQAHVVFGWVSSVGLTPRWLENALIDRFAGMGSVIISNVTGPRHSISVAGTRVTSLLFWVPTSGPVGVGLSVISYAGEITLGIMVDSSLVPDAARLRALLDEELQALQAPSPDPAVT